MVYHPKDENRNAAIGEITRNKCFFDHQTAQNYEWRLFRKNNFKKK